MHIHLSIDSTSSVTNESTRNINKGVTNGKTTERKALVISALILLAALIAGFYGWKLYYEGMQCLLIIQ